MQETKGRLLAVANNLRIVKLNPKREDAYLDVEFCYLQIRLVCELIAVAALAAHYEYGLKRTLLRQWRADEIFAELENLNALSFPVPVRLERKPGEMPCFTPQSGKGISRHRLEEIYGKCGNALHRGALQHALQGKKRVYNVDELNGWFVEIMNTIGEHLILFPKTHKALLVNLTGDADGRVTVAEAQADDEFVVSSEFPTPKPKPDRPSRGR